MNTSFKKSKKSLVFIFFVALFLSLALLILVYISLEQKYIGKPCGGIAANLPESQCPSGLTCVLDGNYPDAGGVCHYLWPVSILLEN